MRQKTGFSDETGREIRSGDNCLLDSGYAHKAGFPDGFPGHIEQDLNNNFWFVHEIDADKIPLDRCHSDLTVSQ